MGNPHKKKGTLINNLLGVVLCGGKSSRMGTDKGLILKNGVPWAQDTALLFSNLGIGYCYSINKLQKEQYRKKIIFSLQENKNSNYPLIVDDNETPGPLRGLLSVHNVHPEKDIFVLACDMPNLNTEILQLVLNEYSNYSQNYDYFCIKNKNRLEPLCSIYTSLALRKLNQTYCKPLDSSFESSKKDKSYSLTNILSQEKTLCIDIHSCLANLLTNQNYPS